MAHVRETKALARETNRRLKDIYILCLWIAGADATNNKRVSAVPDEDIQTTAMPLSSAYDSSEMMKLLQSSDSPLSLVLSHIGEDSMSAICQPGAQSEVPLKRLVSTIEPGRPSKDSEGFFRSKTQPVPLSLEGFNETVSSLKRLANHRGLSLGQHKRTVMDYFLQGVQAVKAPRDLAVKFHSPSVGLLTINVPHNLNVGAL